MHKSFDYLLDNVKGKHKQAKHESLVKSRQKQWPRLVLCANLRNFADHNDLGNHQSVDERDGIVPILDVEFVQQSML